MLHAEIHHQARGMWVMGWMEVGCLWESDSGGGDGGVVGVGVSTRGGFGHGGRNHEWDYVVHWLWQGDGVWIDFALCVDLYSFTVYYFVLFVTAFVITASAAIMNEL